METETKRPLLLKVQDLLMELQERHDDKLDAAQQQVLEPIERRKRILERLRKNWSKHRATFSHFDSYSAPPLNFVLFELLFFFSIILFENLSMEFVGNLLTSAVQIFDQ